MMFAFDGALENDDNFDGNVDDNFMDLDSRCRGRVERHSHCRDPVDDNELPDDLDLGGKENIDGCFHDLGEDSEDSDGSDGSDGDFRNYSSDNDDDDDNDMLAEPSSLSSNYNSSSSQPISRSMEDEVSSMLLSMGLRQRRISDSSQGSGGSGGSGEDDAAMFGLGLGMGLGVSMGLGLGLSLAHSNSSDHSNSHSHSRTDSLGSSDSSSTGADSSDSRWS